MYAAWNKALCLLVGALLLPASTACDRIEKLTQQERKKNDRELAANKHFEQQYPDAQDADWEKKVDFYEVTFTINGMKARSHYSFSGKWIETETQINVKHLPELVCRSIDKMAQDTKREITIQDAEWFESPGTSYYNLTVKTAEGEKRMKIDEYGSVIFQ